MRTSADKLILGNIITLDMRNPMFEALTVKDGLVQYIGSLEIARKLCDDRTEVVDFGRNYVYPGFMDAHCHGSVAGPRLAFFADLKAGETMDEYVGLMKAYMESHPDNAFFYGAGWVRREKDPTAEMLDAICPDKPMALHSADAHSVWLNTKAMETFGVTEDYAKELGPDLVRVRPDGSPTGYISEAPALVIAEKMSTRSKEENKQGLLAWQEFAFSQGITAYYEAGVGEKLLDMYAELIAEGKWKLRIYGGWLVNEKEPDYVACVRQAKAAAEKYNNEYLHITGLKLFMDGVVEAHTAWTLEEYDDAPGYTGVRRFCDFDRTVELYKEASKLGLSVHQHTIGDGAVKFALDCMEKAQIETGNMDMRNALAHLQIVSPEDIRRLCALNAIAVVAPLWMSRTDFGYPLSLASLGEKRTFYSYPMQSFLDYNGVLAFHTDYPVSSAMSIPKSIYMACQRYSPRDEIFHQLNANECISREAAVAGLTLGPAYSVREEGRLGSLTIGSIANMTVYDTDFLHADLETVADAKLVATLVDGEIVYGGAK